MKFRNTPVDGFFALHIPCGMPLTEPIRKKLISLDAVMEDVQYSTHVEEDILYNDVLVMYRKIDRSDILTTAIEAGII